MRRCKRPHHAGVWLAAQRDSSRGGRRALTVRVDWQRSRDRSKIDDLQKTSVQLTLKPGDSIPLDYMVAEPLPLGRTCKAVGMLLRIGLKPGRPDQ